MARITKVSTSAVNMVARFEGGQSRDGKFRPYADPVGVWTIGYGHTTGVVKLLKSRTPAWGETKARRVLKRQLNDEYAPYVARLGLPLNQDMFDALVSFVYNLGPGSIAADTGVGRELRDHHWHKAAAEMQKWNKAGGRVLEGLTLRRKAERVLFLRNLQKKA